MSRLAIKQIPPVLHQVLRYSSTGHGRDRQRPRLELALHLQPRWVQVYTQEPSVEHYGKVCIRWDSSSRSHVQYNEAFVLWYAINELWVFSITIWKQRNSELHGIDGAISMEQRRKDTANEAVAVYQSTIGKVSIANGRCCAAPCSHRGNSQMDEGAPGRISSLC
jgi:hypothetical protein